MPPPCPVVSPSCSPAARWGASQLLIGEGGTVGRAFPGAAAPHAGRLQAAPRPGVRGSGRGRPVAMGFLPGLSRLIDVGLQPLHPCSRDMTGSLCISCCFRTPCGVGGPRPLRALQCHLDPSHLHGPSIQIGSHAEVPGDVDLRGGTFHPGWGCSRWIQGARSGAWPSVHPAPPVCEQRPCALLCDVQ